MPSRLFPQAVARAATLLLVPCVSAGALTQQPPRRPAADTLIPRDSAARLASVRVTVTRDAPRPALELPFAVSRAAPERERPAIRRAGIGDLLFGIPGVQVQDRANPSQDPRIAVRGFGARSAFGVRGVRVLRDGIPVTLPDGQAPVDWIDLESVDRVEVLRGTAAALYGNAAGGVVELHSAPMPDRPVSAAVRGWDGAGVRRAVAQLGGTGAGVGWQGGVTRTAGDGPRDWSRLEATHLSLRVTGVLAGTRLELQGAGYESGRAENPGALTAAELADAPWRADSLNVVRGARKAARQGQLAVRARRGDGARSLEGALFTGWRALDNPLPFAIVTVDRRVAGGSLRGGWRTTRPVWPLRLGAGVDAQWQDDARLNDENCVEQLRNPAPSARCPVLGRETGARRLDQRERVDGVGAYARAEVEAPHALFASVALRHDRVGFRVDDRLVTATNPDDSGVRRMAAVSPMLGVAWRPRPLWSAYLNVATAFETPTITELTNQEDGSAGLNRALQPQRTRTVEVGTQGVLLGRVAVQLAAYTAAAREELVPFDVPNQPGRRAFRNAGTTARRGVEVAAQGAFRWGSAGVAYTHSAFRYRTYQVGTTSFAGNRIPGVPAHWLQGHATARRGALFGTVELTAASSMTATDAGAVTSAGYAQWTVRAGADGVRAGGVRLAPVAGVENLFNRRHAGSVVVNATRGRFYEPGPLRRFTVAVRLTTE
ncbi:MAG: TonB-dependent receptor [Gemmatimonadetes bacterium]|nr:TonB-dependent receptor [Gemmatimonadota bacterium]